MIAALIVAVSLGLVRWLSYRLLRWARSGTGGAHKLVTDSVQRHVGRRAAAEPGRYAAH
jgi:hypothetical protein